MRNKGFFWFFTILLLVVSLYQISFSFVGSSIEREAEQLATQRAEELRDSAEGDSVLLPNGTYLNFETNNEAFDLAKSAFLNEILQEKNDEKVYLGKTFGEVKDQSVALGLDLEGGMSVTLEISMPDLVRNVALNPRDLHFIKPYEAALLEYNTKGGNFVDIFVAKHGEFYPERRLIREFSTEEVVSKIGNRATNAEVRNYLKGLSDGALDGVETIMENRINQFGVAQPNITKDVSTNRIYIELPGVKDQATVKSRLQSTANLEFYLTYKGQELGGFFNELLVEGGEGDDVDLDDLFSDDLEEDLFAEENEETEAVDSSLVDLEEEDFLLEEEEEQFQLSSFGKMFQINIDAQNRFLNSPQLGFAKPNDTSALNTMLNAKAEELMLDNVKFVWGSKAEKIDVTDTLYVTLYALKIPEDLKARVGGSDIESARVSFDPNIGERGVSVEMNSRGSEEWGKMTSENVGNFIAITMDDKVYSAPIINGPILGGSTLISGSFSIAEAQGLADLLNAGALPAPSNIVDEAVVGPTIGAANARSGLISFGVALALVLCYMVFYYGRAGFIANTALVVNIVLLVGFLAAFGAVLTLAGIAGVVLTMGVAIDTNVLIFERAREEIREGKGMKTVIKDGYKNALSAILDANITTILIAVILKAYGSGPIESFATILLIGVFTSVFTGVVVKRLVFEYYLGKKKEFTFSTPSTKNLFANTNVQFIKNRKKFYLVSGALVLIAIVALATRGLKPSVEFTGGRTYETVFTQPVAQKIEDINDLLRSALQEDGR
ncbi:MAG TPA: protein translocase subunit SecD, partial [Brumimicrobium sp.]|nr:protein translocase subunit SecD [Brumimicrobium sp.]